MEPKEHKIVSTLKAGVSFREQGIGFVSDLMGSGTYQVYIRQGPGKYQKVGSDPSPVGAARLYLQHRGDAERPKGGQ